MPLLIVKQSPLIVPRRTPLSLGPLSVAGSCCFCQAEYCDSYQVYYGLIVNFQKLAYNEVLRLLLLFFLCFPFHTAEQILQGPRNQSSPLIVLGALVPHSHHRKGLASASLPVGEDAAVVPF